MNNNKPLILITNDDGYLAKGIDALIKAVKPLGDIVVFAPDGPRSGMSSAITTTHALRYRKHKEEENVTYYICTGTPVDCIKLAMNEVLHRTPDLVITGINHGTNSAISVVYSGTMGAAIEGCIFGIPSVGVSLCDYSADADFSHCIPVAHTIAKTVLEKGLPQGVCLNVNIPKGEVKGIRIAEQTAGRWVKEYAKSTDGVGNTVYWMTGYFENRDTANTENDEWALANGYAAVVPIKIDMTAYDFLPEITKWHL